jgi:hypothetical protein
MRAEINKTENEKTVEKSTTDLIFFEKINKINKHSTRLTQKQREDSNQKRRRNITTDAQK